MLESRKQGNRNFIIEQNESMATIIILDITNMSMEDYIYLSNYHNLKLNPNFEKAYPLLKSNDGYNIKLGIELLKLTDLRLEK